VDAATLIPNVGAGLFVEPPRRQTHHVSHVASFLQDHAMRNERGVHISGHPVGVVGERHRGAADDEQVRYDAAAHQPVAERREGTLEFGPTEQAVIAHAASKSRAER